MPPDLVPEDSPIFDQNILPAFIRYRMMDQDDDCTQFPLFVVYQKREVFNVSEDALDAKYRWRNLGFADTREEPYYEYDPENIKFLDDFFNEHYMPKPGWMRDYYIEVPQFVTCCFTRKAAQRYIDSHAADLNKPYISVDSLAGNDEMIAIHMFLRGI